MDYAAGVIWEACRCDDTSFTPWTLWWNTLELPGILSHQLWNVDGQRIKGFKGSIRALLVWESEFFCVKGRVLHNLIPPLWQGAYGAVASIQTEQNPSRPVTEIRSRMEAGPFTWWTSKRPCNMVYMCICGCVCIWRRSLIGHCKTIWAETMNWLIILASHKLV